MLPLADTTDIAILVDLPFPLYLPDTVQEGKLEPIGPEIYVAGDPPSLIHICRTLKAGNSGIATALELEGGDRFGRYASTRLQVRFNLGTSPALHATSHEMVVAFAMRSINRLISHYRDVRDHPMIEELAAADISHFRVLYLGKGKLLHELKYSTGRGPAVGLSAEELNNYDQRLRSRLQTDQRPRIYRELELRMNRLFLEGDYRGALIEAAVLIESWMKTYVREQFRARGRSDIEIEQMMKDRNGDPVSADRVARRLVHQATDSPFEQSLEFSNWRTKVADVRNDLIHGTRHDVTENETKAAFDTVHATIAVLRRIAPNGTAL